VVTRDDSSGPRGMDLFSGGALNASPAAVVTDSVVLLFGASHGNDDCKTGLSRTRTAQEQQHQGHEAGT